MNVRRANCVLFAHKRVVTVNKNEDSLKIGAIAEAAGVYRLYSPDTVRRVRFIKKAQAIGLTLEETKQVLDLKDHRRQPCRQVAELGEKHLQEINARLAQLRAYHRALARSVSAWRKENVSERRCAGEFCDLIERLPMGRKFPEKSR